MDYIFKIPETSATKALINYLKALDVVELVKPNTTADWYDDLTKEQLESIEIGREQIAAGKGIPHEEVKKKIRKLIESKTA